MKKIILITLLLTSCRSQYKQPEGWLWDRAGGTLNPWSLTTR